jgi:hypothetical protein
VRVGEKETSEQAAIFERYRDLFSRGQLEALREAEAAADGEERERIYRLRKSCEDGLVAEELVEQSDALENAELAARVDWREEELPLRAAQAQLALLESYADRELLGALAADVSASLNEQRLTLIQAGEGLSAELSGEPDPVARSEDEKAISLRELADALAAASTAVDDRFVELRQRWFDRLLGPEREDRPRHYHMAYVRRLSPLESTYTKERATEICLSTLRDLGFDLDAQPNIRPDLEDRPQKSPRACVIPSDPPAVVHLITRAQGGLHDYQAFLHEAGHALHFAGVDPELPYAFRLLARDYALTREPGWHAAYFGLTDEVAAENAEAVVFLESLLFRRYVAKLQFELDFWSRFATDGGTPDGYAERLTAATDVIYRRDNYLADMDAGFYSADYLRAWIRSAQLRAFLIREVGEDWWQSAQTGDFLRALFAEGTRPSSEDIAARIDYAPLDTRPLLTELGA